MEHVPTIYWPIYLGQTLFLRHRLPTQARLEHIQYSVHSRTFWRINKCAQTFGVYMRNANDNKINSWQAHSHTRTRTNERAAEHNVMSSALDGCVTVHTKSMPCTIVAYTAAVNWMLLMALSLRRSLFWCASCWWTVFSYDAISNVAANGNTHEHPIR